MRQKKTKRFSLLYKIFFLSFVIILFLSLFFFLRSNIFTVKQIEVEMDRLNCADSNQVRNYSEVLGKNLILLDSQKIENNLKENYLCIKGVSISKYFPSKIKLYVFSRKPAALLLLLKSEATSSALENFSDNFATPAAEQIDQTFVVDSEGVIYSKDIEQISAPKVYISGQNLIVGQRIKEELINNTLKILEKVKTFGIDIKEAKIYSERILFINATGKILFRLDGKVDIQLASLQLILEKAKIDGKSLEFVDLRFDKPVVKFAPKKNG